MTSLNATVMLSQYGGRQQSKCLNYKKKIYVQKWKVCKKEESIMGMRGRYVEKPVTRDHNLASLASLVMPNSDPRDRFSHQWWSLIINQDFPQEIIF